MCEEESIVNIIKKITPVILVSLVTGIYSNSAQAETEKLIQQLQQYSQEGTEQSNSNNLNQVTNVNQLRDVSPTDWAYEALRSLVDRYGCIVGYPNQTYRGNRALSRYEFAAGLNSCLNQIERLIASQGSVGQEDLEKISRLNQEFEAELAAIGGRVDEIESRTAVLEDNQFSTTTKLVGEVIFGLGNAFSSDDEVDDQTVFGYRTRLELETSFTGEDLLFTRLSTGNFPAFADATGTFQGDLAFAEPAEGDIGLEVLFYDFPVTDSTNILVGAAGLAADDIADTVNVLDGDGGSGAISLFGTRSPIYLPAGETGLGIIQNFGDIVELSAGYLAGEASDPSDGSGLFGGSFNAIGQLLFTPTERLDIALTYVNGFNKSDTETGSDLSNIQFLTEEVFENDVPTSNNAYGAQFSFALSDRIVIGAWGGLNKIRTLSDLDGQLPRGSQDIWNWAATLAFPDLITEGSLGGIVVGMEPWVTSSTIDVEDFDEDDETSFHAEVFYQYQLNDNIAITPGVVYISNPENTDDSDDLFIGTVRTTFNF